MSTELSKLLKEQEQELKLILEMEPQNPNDGDAVGFSLNKNPLSSYGQRQPTATSTAFTGVDGPPPVAAPSLPFPLQNSQSELIHLYTVTFEYREKVKEALRNPLIKESKSKTLALTRIKNRLTLILKVIKKMPPLLEHVLISDEKEQNKNLISTAEKN